MKKIWSQPNLTEFGTVTAITQDTTATCGTNEKTFGSADGFAVDGQSIKCVVS